MKNNIVSLIETYKKQCDYLEIRTEEKQQQGISIRNEDVSGVSSENDCGGCVRVFKDGGTGFVSFTDFSKLETYIQKAISYADEVKGETFTLPEVPSIKKHIKAALNNSPLDVPVDEKIALFKKYAKQILSFAI